MTYRTTLFALALAATPLLAQADGPNPYVGEWTLQMKDAGGNVMPAADNIVLVIDANGGGTYDNRSHNVLKTATCSHLQGDVEAVSFTDQKLVFTVNKTKKIASCPDFRVSFEKQPDGSLAGRFTSMKNEGQVVGENSLVAHKN